MKVLVYLEEERLVPKGGPYAVGYYYYDEMKRRGEDILTFTHVDQHVENVHKWGRSITSHLPEWLNNIHRTIRGIKHRKKLLDGELYAPVRDFSEFDIIHFHQSDHFFLERENLKNYKGVVLFQSHSPLPWGQEQCKDISKWYERSIPHMKEKYEAIDRWCFERANYIIFPCPEAEEPYIDNWPYFSLFRRDNISKFRYILTGIMPAKAKRSRYEVLNQYGIPDSDFVISYVGRHNTVKGYDILKEIAGRYFDIDSRSWVIAAGLESPFKRLNHPRWKEIGFTNDPHSLISASDVFILPNRVTYFDIVMLEILSQGKIVIASRTGGNKFFEKMGVKGVFLYDSIDDAINLLCKVKSLPKEERLKLEQGNTLFFNENLSCSAMYDSYLKLLKEIKNTTKPIV